MACQEKGPGYSTPGPIGCVVGLDGQYQNFRSGRRIGGRENGNAALRNQGERDGIKHRFQRCTTGVRVDALNGAGYITI